MDAAVVIARIRHFSVGAGAFALLLMLLSLALGTAHAAEPRPWLCRDKPVFSSDKPMRFEATSSGPRHWRIFFMQFDPIGGHDGFTVHLSRDLSPASPAQGDLQAGRFFSVALYRAAGGRWVCPGQARQVDGTGDRSVVIDVSYGAGASDACRLKLVNRDSQ